MAVLFGSIVPRVMRALGKEGKYQSMGELFVTEMMKGKLIMESGLYKEDDYHHYQNSDLRMI